MRSFACATMSLRRPACGTRSTRTRRPERMLPSAFAGFVGPDRKLAGRFAQRVGRGGRGPSVFRLDTRIDFLAVDLDLRRCIDSELHLPGAHFEDRDLDHVPDPDVLAQLPC